MYAVSLFLAGTFASGMIKNVWVIYTTDLLSSGQQATAYILSESGPLSKLSSSMSDSSEEDDMDDEDEEEELEKLL